VIAEVFLRGDKGDVGLPNEPRNVSREFSGCSVAAKLPADAFEDVDEALGRRHPRVG
jgi:hypothetical protein